MPRVLRARACQLPLETAPARLEAIQAPARVFVTLWKAAAWLTRGIRHRHPGEPNQQTSETGCSRSPAREMRG